jgi:hypothetical protein
MRRLRARSVWDRPSAKHLRHGAADEERPLRLGVTLPVLARQAPGVAPATNGTGFVQMTNLVGPVGFEPTLAGS